MKRWQKALADIRLLGPDVPDFNADVRYVYAHIEYLEGVVRRSKAHPHLAPAILTVADDHCDSELARTTPPR